MQQFLTSARSAKDVDFGGFWVRNTSAKSIYVGNTCARSIDKKYNRITCIIDDLEERRKKL